MRVKVENVTRVFPFPCLNKILLNGLAEKCDADVDIKRLEGGFELSGHPKDVQTLVTEAIRHCPLHNCPA